MSTTSAKFLEMMLTAMLVGMTSFSAYADRTPQTCGANRDVILAPRLGDDYGTDSNIVELKIASSRISVFTDTTPTVNPSRYVLAQANDGYCLVLFAPAANSISFSKARTAGMPLTITTETAGQSIERYRIVYDLKIKLLTYQPAKCISINNRTGTKKGISCARWLRSLN